MKLPKRSFDPRNLSPSRLVGFGSVMMSVALVGALVFGSIGNKGRPSVKVALDSTGSAWFASPDLGTAALIDGTTVTRVADVPVFPSHHNIEVVQAGSGADVLDHSSGQVRYIDGTSLTPSSPVVLGLPNDSHLSLRSTGAVTWALERGGTAAQQLDPQTLIPVGPPVPLADPAASAVIGTDGTLWVVDGSSLRSVQGDRIRTNLQLANGTSSQLVMASGRPVVVDPADHRAVEINTASGKPSHSGCFESTTDPRGPGLSDPTPAPRRPAAVSRRPAPCRSPTWEKVPAAKSSSVPSPASTGTGSPSNRTAGCTYLTMPPARGSSS